jgi:hypothetical protein
MERIVKKSPSSVFIEYPPFLSPFIRTVLVPCPRLR